jgi:hypothetical protein
MYAHRTGAPFNPAFGLSGTSHVEADATIEEGAPCLAEFARRGNHGRIRRISRPVL